jgi:hypothetical protein
MLMDVDPNQAIRISKKLYGEQTTTAQRIAPYIGNGGRASTGVEVTEGGKSTMSACRSASHSTCIFRGFSRPASASHLCSRSLLFSYTGDDRSGGERRSVGEARIFSVASIAAALGDRGIEELNVGVPF